MPLKPTSMLQPLLRPQSRISRFTNRAFYATPTANERVQTPVQSQSKGSVAPNSLESGRGPRLVSTPVQSLNPSNIAPAGLPQSGGSGKLIQTWPLLYLTFGMVGVGVFSYFYYGYRKEHMDKKWAAMQEEARQNVKNRAAKS